MARHFQLFPDHGSVEEFNQSRLEETLKNGMFLFICILFYSLQGGQSLKITARLKEHCSLSEMCFGFENVEFHCF